MLHMYLYFTIQNFIDSHYQLRFLLHMVQSILFYLQEHGKMFLPQIINIFYFLILKGVDNIARPRTNEISRYKAEDRGLITFVRGDIEAEIPTVVTQGGKAYTGREFEGKRVIILVLRD